MSSKLNPGDMFPSMQLNTVDGGTIDLPIASGTPLTLVLFYRGHW
jgi:peroxiredoxin